MRRAAIAAAFLALSACATTAPPELPAQNPSLMGSGTGLERVLGLSASGLVALFGDPAQDIQEPGARKLQFSNGSCVLDTYLYAERGGSEQVVTYVDARNPAGDDVDRAACVEALAR